ncbi:ATP-dependent helicase [Eubacterium oxidoreducens]|uniref:DNA 3'-5' helicase n=1 Tax=Eubacterium oxidoreducens TaxID=1732 RepID=A0A1G6BFH3_EUBOX|nr:ATP-dependent helicase [Eubacterium oxidoreducens]SDB19318.1 DNA helicase-2 / ATP-dependent DNA helicase PcrA [Eubacterium oxidoreducens]
MRNYSSSQIQAITAGDGPCFCIAGPGSGKTSVIINRVSYLISHYQVAPTKILVVTFTKAAAMEMRNRYEVTAKGQNRAVTFSTFHSLFFTILRHAYHYKVENIIRPDVQYAYLREIARRHHVAVDQETDFLKSLLEEISLVKNQRINPENYYAKCCSQDSFRKIFMDYTQRMKTQRLIDFDDMQVYTLELLKQRPDYAKAWADKYPYLMIDEFQDISTIQYEIVKLLASIHKNIFVVGDDDQSIYRFRGASPMLCFQFLKDFPKAKQITLSENYRCPKSVVELAGKLISHNETRFEKNLTAVKDLKSSVKYSLYKNQFDEAKAIVRKIQEYVKAGGKYEEIAILFRTNKQPSILTECLIRNNIPFRLKEHLPNIYEHWISEDIFTYIRIALGSRQRSDFYKIMNRPLRYLSRDSLDDATVSFEVWMDYYEEQDWMMERIDKLQGDLRMLSTLSPYAGVMYILNVIGYRDYIREHACEHGIAIEELTDVTDFLLSSAKEAKNYKEWSKQIEHYKNQIEQKVKQDDAMKDCVSVMTLHSSKGLEYPMVFIPDINEGLLPYKKATLAEEIEEERRLLYVGMTRAKEKLFLSASKKILHHDSEPSVFLKEMGFSMK